MPIIQNQQRIFQTSHLSLSLLVTITFLLFTNLPCPSKEQPSSISRKYRAKSLTSWSRLWQFLACLGAWLTESLGRRFWRVKESRKAGHSSRRKSDRLGSRSSRCAKRRAGGEKDSPGWKERFGWNSGKIEEFMSFGRTGSPLRRTIRISWGYAGRKLEEPKPS